MLEQLLGRDWGVYPALLLLLVVLVSGLIAFVGGTILFLRRRRERQSWARAMQQADEIDDKLTE